MQPDQGPRDERVLVTGGAGFIGSHLAEALSTHNDVVVYDSLAAGSRSNLPDGVTFVEADLRDRRRLTDVVADVDRVFHEAALVSVARSIRQPRRSHAINVAATIDLLEAARGHDVPVVLASSAAIYGAPIDLPIDESHPTDPLSPYGLEKLTVDRYARLYRERYGLDVVALRYFNVYGPRQTGGDYAGVISTFVEQAIDGGPITVHGSGEQTRDFVHVRDVVRANLRAADLEPSDPVTYNVGTGTETTIRALAESVRDLADTDADIDHGPAREGDVPRSVADIDRARERLGFTPSVDLDDGLASLMPATAR